MNLEEFRRNYSMRKLSRKDLCENPVEQFEAWLKEMIATDMADPTAMVVATVNEHQQPNQRYVLLKSVEDDSFIFFTDTSSAKGQELSQNPKVSLLFPWHMYERQVRVQGEVKLLSRERVEAYFHSRPVSSQVAAYTSKQSELVETRQDLIDQYQKNKTELGDEVPLPERWGGYSVKPTSFEFWQGGDDRLHDRFRYRQGQEQWIIERLQP